MFVFVLEIPCIVQGHSRSCYSVTYVVVIFRATVCDCAAVLAEPNGTTLRRLFQEITSQWPHPFRHEECYTVSAFADLEQQVGPEKAFCLISEAARITLEQTDAKLRETALSLLYGLVRSSNTTEVPPGVAELLRALKLQGGDSAYYREIEAWYRLGT